MNKRLRILLLILGFVSLIFVRFFSNKFLEDPLQLFFEEKSMRDMLPKLNFWDLFQRNSLLFFINEGISLFIIFLFFRDKNILKFAFWFYKIAFIVLSIAFFILLSLENPDYNRILFYTRRFLIHPIFLLVLLPAFYFQKKNEES